MAYYILKSYKLGKISPLELFWKLSSVPGCFFLDSSMERGSALGRFSFLGANPFLNFQAYQENPFARLRKLLNSYKIILPKTDIPFLGGGVGYLTYDLGLTLEPKVRLEDKKGIGIPDCYFNFYNTVIIIDHWKKMVHISSLGLPEKSGSLSRALAQENTKKMIRLLSKAEGGFKDLLGDLPKRKPGLGNLKSSFSKKEYLLAVKKAKGYIKKGDIYQVNLAQQFQGRTELSALDIYQRLRLISPSNFGAYFDAGDFQIVSSSPERFLNLTGDIVTTVPMKGTRPRSSDKSKDRQLKQDLVRSEKDKAELMMIVDLERNDLGRVCNYDSVRVETLRKTEEYNTVFQTTATISGRMHKGKDRIDLLRACFPGGSITGCPKIRAMEIIEELEPVRRSIYTGCFGYLSFSGNLDFNILIRTILKKGENIYFGAGGGIVADSLPEDEYQETLVKAKAMLVAVNNSVL